MFERMICLFKGHVRVFYKDPEYSAMQEKCAVCGCGLGIPSLKISEVRPCPPPSKPDK